RARVARSRSSAPALAMRLRSRGHTIDARSIGVSLECEPAASCSVRAVTDEGARLEELRGRRVRRWRRGRMGWGRSADVPTVRRWEKALRAERSASFELARLAARIPILRRVLGL